MPSPTTATRTIGRRCVACNQPASAWFCLTCGLNTQGRNNDGDRHPYKSANYAKRQDLMNQRETAMDFIQQEDNSCRVKTATQGRVCDPRRWCCECMAYIRHRADCAVIATDGPYVGACEPKSAPKRFTQLQTPEHWWRPTHFRQHERALRARWAAFMLQWEHIGMAVFTDFLNGKFPRPLIPPKVKRRKEPSMLL